MSDLEIRPLRPDEIARFVENSHYIFNRRTREQRAADFDRRVTAERNILVGVEDGEIVSQVMIYEFGIWIDGARYPTGGLANVVTVPEKTGRGYARQVLRATIAWMRNELGQCLSTLYPTVFPIYRGLGWGNADDTWHISGPPTAFRPNPSLPEDSGSRLVRRLARREDVDLIGPLYEQFARPRSGYLDRPRWYWEDTVFRLGWDNPSWLGLWYGSDGTLAGYVVYSHDRAAEWHLEVYEVVALRPEVYRAILNFLSAHNLQDRVELAVGRDVPWRTMVVNPHLIKVEAQDNHNFMVRIVDLPRVIALRPVPGSGDPAPVTIQVDDENAPWNHGVWRLQLARGQWEATRDEESASPDARANIATLSSLIVGFLTVSEAIDTGLLRATDEARPTLEALFRTAYPPTSRDYF